VYVTGEPVAEDDTGNPLITKLGKGGGLRSGVSLAGGAATALGVCSTEADLREARATRGDGVQAAAAAAEPSATGLRDGISSSASLTGKEAAGSVTR